MKTGFSSGVPALAIIALVVWEFYLWTSVPVVSPDKWFLQRSPYFSPISHLSQYALGVSIGYLRISRGSSTASQSGKQSIKNISHPSPLKSNGYDIRMRMQLHWSRGLWVDICALFLVVAMFVVCKYPIRPRETNADVMFFFDPLFCVLIYQLSYHHASFLSHILSSQFLSSVCKGQISLAAYILHWNISSLFFDNLAQEEQETGCYYLQCCLVIWLSSVMLSRYVLMPVQVWTASALNRFIK